MSVAFLAIAVFEVTGSHGFSASTTAWSFWICYYVFFGSMHVGLTFVVAFAFPEGRNWIRDFNKAHRVPFFYRMAVIFLIFLGLTFSFYFYESLDGWAAVFITFFWILIRGVALPAHVIAQQKAIYKLDAQASGISPTTSLRYLTAFMPVAIVSQVLFSRYLNAPMERFVGFLYGLHVHHITVAVGIVLTVLFLHSQIKAGWRQAGLSLPITCSMVLWILNPFSIFANFAIFAIHGSEYVLTFFRMLARQPIQPQRRLFALGVAASLLIGFAFLWRSPFQMIFQFVGDTDVVWKRELVAFQQALGFLHLELDAWIYGRSNQRGEATPYHLLQPT